MICDKQLAWSANRSYFHFETWIGLEFGLGLVVQFNVAHVVCNKQLG